MRVCATCTLQNEDDCTACGACALPLPPCMVDLVDMDDDAEPQPAAASAAASAASAAWLDGVSSRARAYALGLGEDLLQVGLSQLDKPFLPRRDALELAFAMGQETETRRKQDSELRLRKIYEDRMLRAEQDFEAKLAVIADDAAAAAKTLCEKTSASSLIAETANITGSFAHDTLPRAQTLEETRVLKRARIAASYAHFT